MATIISLPPNTNVRRLTVLRRYLPCTTTRKMIEVVPDIHLRGKWLAAQGFRSGHTVDITCEEGKIVITLSETQRFANL